MNFHIENWNQALHQKNKKSIIKIDRLFVLFLCKIPSLSWNSTGTAFLALVIKIYLLSGFLLLVNSISTVRVLFHPSSFIYLIYFINYIFWHNSDIKLTKKDNGILFSFSKISFCIHLVIFFGILWALLK